jgi:hypothetical protein
VKRFKGMIENIDKRQKHKHRENGERDQQKKLKTVQSADPA